jgi:hypothetical protein
LRWLRAAILDTRDRRVQIERGSVHTEPIAFVKGVHDMAALATALNAGDCLARVTNKWAALSGNHPQNGDNCLAIINYYTIFITHH